MDSINYVWENIGVGDETFLAQQLYDTYGGEKNNGELILLNGHSSEQYVTTTPTVCGFRDEQTLRNFEINGVINITKKYFDKVISTEIYKVDINWEALRQYASFLHDKEADAPLGEYKQKRLLKEKIESVFEKHNVSKGVISEKILGEYLDHDSTAQVIRGDDAPDKHIQFISTLRELEKENFLKIIDIEFNFKAVPELSNNNIKDWSLSMGSEIYFYPAQHCAVTLSLINQKVQKETKKTKEKLAEHDDADENIPKPKLGDSKLEFNPDDGITIYRGAEWVFKGKGRALLTFLHKSKNTPFPLADIMEKCNPNISNKRSYFKAQKDAWDTVEYIRRKLKVKKGEFFPIRKTDENWIWLEK